MDLPSYSLRLVDLQDAPRTYTHHTDERDRRGTRKIKIREWGEAPSELLLLNSKTLVSLTVANRSRNLLAAERTHHP